MSAIPEVAFSGANAVARRQLVRYITERCVFELTPEGLELAEIAPGIDLQTQILDQMGFAPRMRRPPRPMNPAIFREGRMGLLESLFTLDMDKRLRLSADARTLYIDLHGVSVTSTDAVARIGGAIEAFFARAPELARRVDVLVNYDGFDCREELVKDFADMARGLEARFYGAVRRVSGAGFARRKLADSMGVALRSAHTHAEAVDLLLSMGFPVSRAAAVGMCARFDGGDSQGVVASEELSSILNELSA